MTKLLDTVLKLKIWKDTRGQDLTEYALMAAFVATICGAASPEVAGGISTVFSKITAALDASGGGSGTLQ